MRKTRQTILTSSVVNEILKIRNDKNLTWRELDFQSAGYSETGYTTIGRILKNGTLELSFVVSMMVMLGVRKLETPEIRISIKGKDHKILEELATAIKMDIAALKPEKENWRQLGDEYAGYSVDAGSFYRGIVKHKWTPIETLYFLCRKFNVTYSQKEDGDCSICWETKKEATPVVDAAS